MSARNAWFIHVQRMAPLASPTTAWKILKPRRRVIASVRALDLAEHRRLRARPQRGDRLHAAAVLVAERQPVEQIFDGDEAGALEIRGLARTDAFQELERSVERIGHDGSGDVAASTDAPGWPATERRPPAPGRLRSAGCSPAASNASSRRTPFGLIRRARVVATRAPAAASSAPARRRPPPSAARTAPRPSRVCRMPVTRHRHPAAEQAPGIEAPPLARRLPTASRSTVACAATRARRRRS